MSLVKSIQTQMKHWKPLLSKLNVETGDDVEMIGVVEGYALRYMLYVYWRMMDSKLCHEKIPSPQKKQESGNIFDEHGQPP